MIDFIKVNVSLFKNSLLQNKLLDFGTSVNITTGEILPKLDSSGNIVRNNNGDKILQDRVAKYKNLEFRLKPDGRMFMSGSLHKYWNFIVRNENQNHNDFHYQDLIYVLNDIQKKFIPNLHDTLIIRLEYGVNIDFPTYPKSFINDRILEHSGDPPTRTQIKFFNEEGYQVTGYFKEFHRSKDKIKIYDKGLMYRLIRNILRFEINTLVKYLNKQKIEITSLGHLIQGVDYETLHKILIQQFNKLFILDDIADSELTETELKIVNLFRNEKKRHKLKNDNRFKYYFELRKYIKLCNAKGKLTQNHISKLIADKWGELQFPNKFDYSS